MNSKSIPAGGAAAPAKSDDKYLTFSLGSDGYALPILKVREIVGFMNVTAASPTAGRVCGTITLRGQLINVIDLRPRFPASAADKTGESCIIVVEIAQSGQKQAAGIVADRVTEVINLREAQVQPARESSTSIDPSFITGTATIGGATKILLNVERLLGGIAEVESGARAA